MLFRNVAVLLGAVLVLMTILIAESGGGDKRGEKRGGRSATAELAATAAETIADEELAQCLQNEENKKVSSDNTSGCTGGGPSDARLAEILQDEENKQAQTKSPAKKQKVFPQLKARSAGSAAAPASDAAVRHTFHAQPACHLFAEEVLAFCA